MRYGVHIGVFVLLLTCLFGGALWAAHTWYIETVDPDGAIGYNCLALDSAGRPHIAHDTVSGDPLRYAWFNGTTWVNETIDPTGILSWELSLALDSNNRGHVSYRGYWVVDEVAGYELRYARYDGNDWDDIQTIERSSNHVGMYNSLALDSSDRPRIAHCDWTVRDLKYSKWISGTTWQTEIVDSDGIVGSRCALALDSLDRPHIAYEDLTNDWLKYAEWTGAAWDFSRTMETYGVRPSLVLDADDHPHIAYTNYTTGDLCYVEWNGTGWDTPSIVDDSDPDAYPCLALGPGDLPGIAYAAGVGAVERDVKYAEWNPGTETWDIKTVDSGRAGGMELWLALTAAGEPQITFTDSRLFPVMYADLLYASGIGPLAVRWPRDGEPR